MLTQPEFPPHRRLDPMRQAELEVYNELAASDYPGRTLYELKTSRAAPELDFAVLLEKVGVYGIQVKGGQYRVQRGNWQLVTHTGPIALKCPIKLTWDSAMQIRETVQRELKRKVFVMAVLVLPDMEPDPAIEERAKDDRVEVLFGVTDLVKRLVELAANHDIYNPPSPWLVDEIAEVLMPYLADEDDDDDGDNDSEGWDRGIDPKPAPQAPPPEPAGEMDLIDRKVAIQHADIVHVYNSSVTIYQGTTPPAGGATPEDAGD